MILTASNTEEFLTKASGVGSVALENTMQRLLDKLKEFIEDDVYSYDYNDDEEPTGHYWQRAGARTGEFKESWEYENVTQIGNIVASRIFQNHSTMYWAENTFQHGSNQQLAEEVLAEIINDGKIGHAFGFPDIGDRPFWNDFLDWVDTNIDNIFTEECNKVGLSMVSVSHFS